MGDREPDVDVAPTTETDLDALPMDDLPTEPATPRDDGGADSVQPANNRKCSICCEWWSVVLFALFQFIFGVACLAVNSAREHNPGIAFGVLVILILVVYLLIRRKDISLAKIRCRGAPDPHIDETVGRARSIPKTFLFCLFILIAFVFSLIAFILTAIAWQSVDPSGWDTFPTACSSSLHCARVSDINGVGVDITPPTFNCSTSAIIAATDTWLDGIDDNTPDVYVTHKVLDRSFNYIHSRIIEGFWGFTDDFAVFAVCSNVTGATTVYAQSQSRVSTGGSGNPDKNPKRLEKYFAYMSTVSLPVGVCNA